MKNDVPIRVSGLTKKFGDFTAVNDVSFEVKKGEIFGFLGSNGSGKSTTIRMLIGILEPTAGTAVVGGYNVLKNPEKVKETVGYMSQRFSLYEDLTVYENLNFYGGIYGMRENDIKSRINWVLEKADMKGKEHLLARELPSGWKQRLALSCALLHRPKIVFLDEPTSGVDPVSRRNFWNLINFITEEGITVFVTTHYLEEAEYCNNLAFIHFGRIIISGNPSELKRNVIKRSVFEIESREPIKISEILKKEDFIEDVSIFGVKVHVMPKTVNVNSEYLKTYMKDKSIGYKRINEIIPSLEDVFIELIKQKDIRE